MCLGLVVYFLPYPSLTLIINDPHHYLIICLSAKACRLGQSTLSAELDLVQHVG